MKVKVSESGGGTLQWTSNSESWRGLRGVAGLPGDHHNGPSGVGAGWGRGGGETDPGHPACGLLILVGLEEREMQSQQTGLEVAPRIQLSSFGPLSSNLIQQLRL